MGVDSGRLGNAAAVAGGDGFDGGGPLDDLARRLDVELSVETAERLARSDDVAAQLSEPYLRAYSAAALRLGTERDWHAARRRQQVALAAVEHVPASVDGLAMRRAVQLPFMEIVRRCLHEVPRGRDYHRAMAVGDALARLAERLGDADTRAAATLQQGLLNIEPYVAARNVHSFVTEYRRWRERLTEEYGFGLYEPRDRDEEPMPPLGDALDLGTARLESALRLGVPAYEATAAYGLVEAMHARFAIRAFADRHDAVEEISQVLDGLDLNRELDERRLAELARRALDGLRDVTSRARLLTWLTELGAPPPPALLQPLWHVSAAALARDLPPSEAAERVLAVAELWKYFDPRHGLELVGAVREVFGRCDEHMRWRWIRTTRQLMVSRVGISPQEIQAAGGVTAAARRVAELADRNGWDAIEVVRAMAAVAMSASRWGEYGTGIELLRGAERLAPELVAAHPETWMQLQVALMADEGTAAELRQDWRQGARSMLTAAVGFLELGLFDGVLESLRDVERILSHDDANVEIDVIVGLAFLAIPVEEFGDHGVRVLQRIYRRLSALIVAPLGRGEAIDAEALLICWQLAKGLRWAEALRSGRAYDPAADAEGASILAQIEEASRPYVADSDDPLLDEAVLLTPYSDRLPARRTFTAADRVDALRRRFDAHVHEALLTDSERREPTLLSPGAVMSRLPPDAVLLVAFLGMDLEGGIAAHYLALTAEGGLGVGAALGERSEMVSLGFHGTEERATLELLASHLLQMRLAITGDPGPRNVSRMGADMLATEMEWGTMFGTVVPALERFYAEGKRHLVVVPHGPLHFLPFHLIGRPDEPLADSWTVTYLPNLSLAGRDEPAPGPAREQELTAIGLDFAEPGSPLSAINGEAEAQAIAAAFGGMTLLGGAARRETVLAALERSRYCHIATHGAHNVAAPAFQKLFVAPDQGAQPESIDAFELLSLDLSGLELLTLSACETSLGRYDRSDNVRGIASSAMLRGAQAVVGTLWPVHDDVSQLFFGTLYGRLRESGGRVRAFRAAQLAARAAFPHYRDWGAFYYSGDWS